MYTVILPVIEEYDIGCASFTKCSSAHNNLCQYASYVVLPICYVVAAMKGAQPTPLSKFLKSISSEKYELNLVNCDYTTISELKDASSDDLKECGLSPKARKGNY